MVSFASGGGRSFTIAFFEPCKHRFAYMYTPVIDKVDLYDVVSVGSQKLRNGPSEKIVANVAQMERFVGVGRRKFHHHGLSCRRQPTVILIFTYGFENAYPERGSEFDI